MSFKYRIDLPDFLTLQPVGLVVSGMALISIVSTSVYSHENKVSISTKGNQRCIQSNGLPDHNTGKFPNRGNPHTISAQNVKLCVSTKPKKGTSARYIRGSIGVALNGVQIRPGTADYYDANSPRGFSRNRRSGWNLEGIGARNKLGMDHNDAHVDERGLYHYHGVASALINSGKGTLIGYAADGFEIHYVGSRQTSSYRLKKGNRPSSPGGKYDGTYIQDWQYVAGSGSLDQCNGGRLNGKFVYFATKSYPFFPRCLWGAVSSDFKLRGPRRQAMNRPGPERREFAPNRRFENRQFNNRRGQDRRQNRRVDRRGPPQQAIAACSSVRSNSRCSFNAPNGRRITGSCRPTPANVVACVPRNRGG